MDFIEHLRWRPQIGDPSFMGWLTVAAYGGAAVTAAMAARRHRHCRHHSPSPNQFRTWIFVAIVMALLCLNKQLDLQSLATDLGRVFSRQQGWYEERRSVQKWFVLSVPALSLLLASWLAFRFRQFWQHHFLLAAGLIFLGTFIVLRAISFHHVDQILKSRLAGVKINWLLELTGIALVWLAAALDTRPAAPAARHPHHH